MFEYEFYTVGSVILKRLGGNNYDIDYVLIGCDYPINTNDSWNFWQEIGYKNGESQSFGITLPEIDEAEVKKYIISHKEDFAGLEC